MSDLRPGATEAIEAVISEWARLVIFEAPTGYGKTRLGPTLYRRAVLGAGVAARVLHALPLRAIVEEAFGHYAGELGGQASVGYQAHGLDLEGKSPFYAADTVVTTMDSLAFNLFRSSVGERGLGHFEVPRGHIASSLVVLDEAHLPLRDREGPASAIAAMVYTLTRMGVPVLVETATLPPSHASVIIGHSATRVVCVRPVPRRGAGEWPGPCPPHSTTEVVDDDYYGWASGIKWRYGALPGLGDAVEAAARHAGEGLRVFLAADTVAEAVEAYEALRARGIDATLVHGRLTVEDRKAAIERAKHASVVVGTSAVEAGVNLDVDVVVTSVPEAGGAIAWDSVIQRLGRACRSPSRTCGEVRVYFYGLNARGAAQAMEELGVNPRLPWTYTPLLQKAAPVSLDTQRVEDLMELALSEPQGGKWINAMHKALCTPFRKDLLIKVALVKRANKDEAVDALLKGRYITINLNDVPRALEKGWLHKGSQGHPLALLESYQYKDNGGHAVEELQVIKEISSKPLCSDVLRWGVAALLGRLVAYKPGVGLA